MKSDKPSRDALFLKLVALGEKRGKTDREIDAVRRDLGLEPEDERRPERVYLLANVIVAIEHYLKEQGHALTKDELVEALVARGAGSVQREQHQASRSTSPRWRVSRSIEKGLRPGDGKKPSLKETDGLIGLAAWPKEKFKPK